MPRLLLQLFVEKRDDGIANRLLVRLSGRGVFRRLNAMAAALDSLKIVRLSRLNSAKTWPSPYNIDYETWQAGTGYIRYAFLFKTYPR